MQDCVFYYSMDESKDRRKEYKRKWIAAKCLCGKKQQSSTQLRQLESSSEEDVAPEEPPKQSATSVDIQRSLIQSRNALDSNHDISHLNCSDDNDHADSDAGDREVWSWDMIDSHMIESSETESDSNRQMQAELAK